ncbi:6-carboxy-5,6,7,8-tetrahydropterin synthase [Lacunisphaera limnophila]|uniref:6-carboxy-5,6,7,8-tetrahydropterin synthase n=1 Tax=Lacunisphaera limnophila TaxID=1838286 RepID=A0A1D8AUQ8_9BACT|nr:6-carboxytetrahydropterin synthase [Lacunisphaera limnophila]AOS44631.1 6-carboxy-5,6,7,8-tetrahydropterin synthase [Lacunisphaera limnophila]
MPYRIAKTLTIESGHLLTKHRGRCRFPHGHSRTVEVVIAADQLDANDMVCDFKALKHALNEFLDRWDHAFCLNTADPQFAFFQQTYAERVIPFVATDPTSEVMARTIFDTLQRTLQEQAQDPTREYPIPTGVRLERVRVTETATSWAEYSA